MSYRNSGQWVLFGTVILLTITSHAATPEGYGLHYRLNKQRAYRYAVTDSVHVLQEIMGMQQRVNTVARGTVTVQAEDTDNAGNLTFLMWYDTMELSIVSMIMDTTLINPIGVVGKKLRKTIKPNGDQIKSIEIDPFDVRLGQQMPTDKEFFSNLPHGKLSPGDAETVSDSDTLSVLGGKIVSHSELQYTLAGLEDNSGYLCARIEVSGSVALVGQTMMSGLEVAITGDGEVSATILFAVEEGLLLSSLQTNKIDMTAAISGAQNMTIPITQEMVSTVALIERSGE
jgi:hypothetical protein